MASNSDFVLTPSAASHLNQASKRPVNPTGWKDQVAKKNRQSGNPYKGKNDNFHPGILPPGDAKACTRCNKDGCTLSGNVKRRMFTEFRSTDQNGQYSILAGCISVEEPQQRMVAAPFSRKQSTYKYTVQFNGRKLAACKATLMHIFGISSQTIRVVTKKMKSGQIRIVDQRGKHDNRPTRVSDDKHRAVVQHISSFPTYESHYTRQDGDPNRLYLYAGLNLSRMYDLYIEQQRENDRQDLEVEEYFYRHIFNTMFKLRFSMPKQDTCDKCDEFKQKLIDCSNEERAGITAEFNVHRATADIAYQSYKTDRDRAKLDPNFVVLTGDLEQIFFTPMLRNSSSFYLRKLSNYNFGIHVASDNSGVMNLWSETSGRRGSNETASCLWKYLTRLPKLQPGESRELVIWLDRCRGQNNNWMLITMLLYLVWDGFFTTVNQKFFVTGHSFNDCDRDFGVIEKKARSATVLVPVDIQNVITEARQQNPFTVVWLASHEIRDFKFHSTHVRKPAGLLVTKSLWFNYSATAPQYIRSKVDHRPLREWRNHQLRTLTGQLMTVMPTAPAHLRVAKRPGRLDAGKTADIRKLMKYLSGDNLTFYQDLMEAQAQIPDADSDQEAP